MYLVAENSKMHQRDVTGSLIIIIDKVKWSQKNLGWNFTLWLLISATLRSSLMLLVIVPTSQSDWMHIRYWCSIDVSSHQTLITLRLWTWWSSWPNKYIIKSVLGSLVRIDVFVCVCVYIYIHGTLWTPPIYVLLFSDSFNVVLRQLSLGNSILCLVTWSKLPGHSEFRSLWSTHWIRLWTSFSCWCIACENMRTQ